MANGNDAAREYIAGEIEEARNKIKDSSDDDCLQCPTRDGVLLMLRMQKMIVNKLAMNWVPLLTAVLVAALEALRYFRAAK